MNFLDVCSGIGGGRLGLSMNGLKCIGHSEINKDADITYSHFYGEETNFGNLMNIDSNTVPDIDFLVGGFPCQTFSILGKRGGFNDERGLVIYGIVKILKEKSVNYFLLENVKGLLNHDKGNTLKVIINELNSIGYNVYYKVINSLDFGVPQMRERIYIVGIKKEIERTPFKWPEFSERNFNMSDFLINNGNTVVEKDSPFLKKYLSNKYNKNKYTFHDLVKEDYNIIDCRQSDIRIYRDRVPTLRTGRHGILYSKNKTLYKLTGKEALLLQGFPKHLLSLVDSCNINNHKLLSQSGNAMTVPVIQKIVSQILKTK